MNQPPFRGNASLVVRPVQGKADLDVFIGLPGRLHRDDPHWVEPLLVERRDHLSAKNPVFAHLDWQAWIAWSGNEPVGRISAQVDRLHRQAHGPDTGHFGMLEAIDDPAVFAALMAAAEQWLRERGALRITGPFNLTINEESGLLVEGFERPPSIMMGHGLPYYGARVEALGYRPATDLLAYWMRTDELHFPPPLRQLMDRWQDRVRIRPLDRRRYAEEIQLLRDIFNDAWAENWGFVPFTAEEFEAMGNNLRLLVPEDLLYIAEVDGEPDAFIVALPNLNEAIAPLQGRLLPFGWLRLLWWLKVRGLRTARVPLMGVRRAHQRSRLGSALALRLIEALKPPFVQHGLEALEMSWILESNRGMRNILERIGAYPYKRYRVYEKRI
ncbi:GNAT family N-acetyltransferase [Azotobacter vinelandii]|uniref:GNAT family N-acetyltransferase n=1 Tax=Azotobacter vinelandii TaxID=354 RepID=UPI000A6CF686|nr:N-acetyltransferase [Azotobacter vinelandii]WKN21310.1 N-acetyltransferase [Azotobacter vinelandii]